MAVQVVIFALGQEEYAMPIEVVREITHLKEVRSIPQAPPYLKGLIIIRGQAIPLIDLHIRFGISSESYINSEECSKETNSFALITEVNGKLVGFAVDKVLEVRILDDVVPPPPLITAPFIGGIVNLPDRIIILMVPERILENEELQGLNDLI
ncbi:MAG: chemotaxis protein CheW [Desulfitobacteriaceae bacterium]